MNIIVTGASGFVGTHLCRVLLDKGHRVTGVGTSKRGRFEESDRFEWISADTTIEGVWQDKIRTSDVVINLTGKNIFGYWTKKYKSQIYRSRILTTENIISAIPDDITVTHRADGNGLTVKSIKKPLLLNASAIGFYGDRGNDSLIESEPCGDDFLATVCYDWENIALKATKKGVRVVLMRFGVVLGKNGGALSKMLPAFKLFLGGPLGNGLQWFPWIHINDLLNAVLFFMDNDEISGPVNIVAPGTLRHREFASALGYTLNRPVFMPAPAFMLKTIMGEMGGSFLSSQKAIPYVLSNKGFSFEYGDIYKALQDILLCR